MKRLNNIFQKIISIDNLRLADERARKGKSNTYGIRLHDKYRDDHINTLHEMLVNKTFSTSTYTTFTIYEPKERIISRLPYYPDRIVHHAIMNVLEPIWLTLFTRDTYSCIKKRGIHGCMNALQKAMKSRPKYCLKIDIKKFYPSIDHNILKQIIRRKIKDKDTLWLLDDIIDSSAGVPIGNYLSQYYANLYLSYFDHWIKEDKHIANYYRYADDMVFLSNDKAQLKELLTDIKLYMSSELNLELKQNYQIFPIASNNNDIHGRGIDYVGYVFYHDELRIRKSIKINMFKRIQHLRKIKIPHKEYVQAICSWTGWFKHCNNNNYNKLIKCI
ncbi:MAG: reverse transcriptase/maturase family protein [Muribaculaceae bacterium]